MNVFIGSEQLHRSKIYRLLLSLCESYIIDAFRDFDKTRILNSLPPAYEARREGNVFSLFVCSQWGYPGSVFGPVAGLVSDPILRGYPQSRSGSVPQDRIMEYRSRPRQDQDRRGVPPDTGGLTTFLF